MTMNRNRPELRDIILAAGLFTVLLGAVTQAKSLLVSPPRYTWDGLVPGVRTEMPRTIRITNLSEQPRAYKLTVRSCADAALAPSSGCEDIPEASWVAFEHRYVTIPAGGQTPVKAYLSIPDEPQYRGRSWQFYVEISEDVPRFGYIQGQPDLFALAVFVKVTVTTAGLPSAVEPNSPSRLPLRAGSTAMTGGDAVCCQVPLPGCWLYCGTVTDIDRLIGGLMGLITGPRSTEMSDKTENL
jgi:hypothetical protein